jgi:hypothetical protein
MYKKFTLCFVVEIDYSFDYKALIDDNFFLLFL